MATLERSSFIKLLAAGSGFALGFRLTADPSEAAPATFRPNAFVRIDPDEKVTIWIGKSEMGQGIMTGLPTILADELDAPMERVVVRMADAEKQYGDPVRGVMSTGGSTSIRNCWVQFRTAGATARAMLVAAAAQRWNVDPGECTTAAGKVRHAASNRTASYGSLAADAATQTVPSDPKLKTPQEWTLIGKRTTPRLDIPAKVAGKAKFGMDVRVPGMLYASVARPPTFGGKVTHFDATAAKKVKGVRDVVQISSGVAVVADNTWAAFQGKEALKLGLDPGPNAHIDSAGLFAEAEKLTATDGIVGKQAGDVASAQGTALEAIYRGPFVAHAAMEPMNATADVRSDRCEVWAPTQAPTAARALAQRITGLPLEKVVLHPTFLGGGFGRRGKVDYVGDAVEVSKRIGKPVKVVWTREDDIQHDFYRPMSLNAIRGVLDGSGNLIALSHKVVAPALARWNSPATYKAGVADRSALNQAAPVYRIPNLQVAHVEFERGVPIGSWRAPGANWNVFVVESFVDELAHAAKRDPLEFRLAMLDKDERAAATLKLAAEKAGWGKPLAKGRALGLGLGLWNGSYGAAVAEVSMVDGMPKVHRATIAVDCGVVVNPDIVAQQAAGALNYGLSAALASKVTLREGRIVERNFYDFTILRNSEAPPIDVHIVPSTHDPSGIGEIGTPPIAPAVANAVFVLTGKRLRSLPLRDALKA